MLNFIHFHNHGDLVDNLSRFYDLLRATMQIILRIITVLGGMKHLIVLRLQQYIVVALWVGDIAEAAGACGLYYLLLVVVFIAMVRRLIQWCHSDSTLTWPFGWCHGCWLLYTLVGVNKLASIYIPARSTTVYANPLALACILFLKTGRARRWLSRIRR